MFVETSVHLNRSPKAEILLFGVMNVNYNLLVDVGNYIITCADINIINCLLKHHIVLLLINTILFICNTYALRRPMVTIMVAKSKVPPATILIP